VISEKRGKESYYEMAEPIMRLCLEIKNQRGRPLRLIARFLRAWFPEEVLQSPEGHGLLQDLRSESYRTFALDLKPDFYEAIKGEISSEIADKIKSKKYQEALILTDELKHADPAESLFTKAYIHYRTGKINDAIFCLDELIKKPDVPADLRIKAFYNRSITHGEQGHYDLALNDCIAVIKDSDVPLIIQQSILFAIPELMIPIRAWSDVMDALTKAFDAVDSSADDYGGTPFDLLKMVLRKGYLEWSTCASDLVEIYTRYGVCDKLGTGLTQSISCLDEGDYSDTQLDAWNEAWQTAGKDNEACEIALKCLKYSVQAIKSHSARPLFNLPLEIRELVLPLLPKTCAKRKKR